MVHLGMCSHSMTGGVSLWCGWGVSYLSLSVDWTLVAGVSAVLSATVLMQQ